MAGRWQTNKSSIQCVAVHGCDIVKVGMGGFGMPHDAKRFVDWKHLVPQNARKAAQDRSDAVAVLISYCTCAKTANGFDCQESHVARSFHIAVN